MATQVTLADIFAAAEQKYGDYEITDYDVKLRPLLRLSAAERDELQALTTAPEEDAEDVEPRKIEDQLREIILLVADNKVGAEKLLEAVGERLDVLTTIQQNWMEKTQAGEAQPSSS